MNLVERPFAPRTALELMKAGTHPLVARLLAARGVRSGEPTGLAGLAPVATLHNGLAMAELLADCLARQDRVLIVADYDADGATACALAVRALRAFGGNVGYLIPHRIEHGYGLTPDIVAVAAQLQPRPRYLLTVDNGISSHEGVAAANAVGMEVLVTDHHLAPAQLPDARLIVNPNQPGCSFPSKALAGCGVMWYVLQALETVLRARQQPRPDPEFTCLDLLPLVAIGTVADVVPLDHNNRCLVQAGLQRIRAGATFVGIDALAQVSKRNPRELSTSDIAFGLGPHINAAGRLASMDQGVECLLTDDPARAQALAQQLHDINQQRRELEATMVSQAVQQWTDHLPAEQRTLVLHDPRWHAGVVGIVAGRIRERAYRPVFVFAAEHGGELKGSGRSIPGFHLRDALDLVAKRAPGVLRKFGGHAMAAGATLAVDQLPRFAAEFEAVGRELLTPALLRQVLETDGPLEPEDMTLATVEALRAEVWGAAFPEPLFSDRFEVVECRRMGNAQEHLRLVLRKRKQTFVAVKFRHEGPDPQAAVRVAYRLDSNTFRDSKGLQLMVEHLEPA